MMWHMVQDLLQSGDPGQDMYTKTVFQDLKNHYHTYIRHILPESFFRFSGKAHRLCRSKHSSTFQSPSQSSFSESPHR